MNIISTYILEYLKEHQEVHVVDFGVFSMKNSAAKVVGENKNILPPGTEIFATINPSTTNNGFAEYIAAKEGLMYHEAMNLLRKSADQWLTEASSNRSYVIENIGVLNFQEENFSFQGDRLTQSSPDFFGLEEIDLEEIKGNTTSQEIEQVEKDSFGKTILWTFLIAIPVAGIVYLALTQKDKLLGKESVVVKTSTHRIPTSAPIQKVDTIKVDTLLKQKADSISVSKTQKPL